MGAEPHIYKSDEKSSIRHERKFLSTEGLSELILHVKQHPAFFRELFGERRINNIYLDTLMRKSVGENRNGLGVRSKTRVRWYGETFGNISQPILEQKIKNGHTGSKRRIPLIGFVIKQQTSNMLVFKAHGSEPLDLSGLKPVLLNSYRRRYFIDGSSRFRLTIDHSQVYYRFSPGGGMISHAVKDPILVVELKYDIEDEIFADEITNHLLLRLSKNSKYINGMDLTSNSLEQTPL